MITLLGKTKSGSSTQQKLILLKYQPNCKDDASMQNLCNSCEEY